LQDRVAEHVAGVLETAVQDQDVLKASARPTANMGSYDIYLRSMWHFRNSRKDQMQLSIDLLDRAIELDPNFAVALSQSCVCHRQMLDHGWVSDPEKYRTRGLELAERALALGRNDARVLSQVAASLPGLEGRMNRAITLIERAIALNPSSSFVWLISGSLQLRNSQPDVAAEHLENSMRLDPISSSANAYSRMYLASARFQQGRFDEALALFETTSLRLPVSFIILAALYGYLGKPKQAREALSQFESLTADSIEHFARTWFSREPYRKLLMDGLALAREASI
jgi:tetratricopeptide (TPR) repeat protein